MLYSADSSKKVDLQLSTFKLFLRLDLLWLIQQFFYDGLPSYDDTRQKPPGYDADPGNYPRLEFNLNLKKSLIIVEQLSRRRIRTNLNPQTTKAARVVQTLYVKSGNNMSDSSPTLPIKG